MTFQLAQEKRGEWLFCVRYVTLLTSDWSNFSLRLLSAFIAILTYNQQLIWAAFSPQKKWCKTFIKWDGGALNTLFWWCKCCNYGNPQKTSPKLIQFFLSRTCYFGFASCIINPELKFNSVRFVNQLDRLVPENWLDSFKNRTSPLSSPVEYGLDSSLSPTEEKGVYSM